jgi:hypothetical protein
VLDAARNDRDKIAIVARRIQGGTQISEGIASLVGSRPGSSQLTGRQPDARSDHRPGQPLGNHMATTVHTELNEQPYPLLRVARPKRFELPTF